MQFNHSITISERIISEQSPVFIIAEAGVNHNGDLEAAKRLIDAAAASGADAVKFQAFKADQIILKSVKKANYQMKTTNANESQYDMLKRLEISQQQNADLKLYCEQRGIMFLTTPFDEESLDELDALNLPAYKIASTDLTNLPFLKKIAMKEKPIFLSTGMSYLEEVSLALQEMIPYNKNVILMQCTANYPIEDIEVNLNVLDTYKEHFDILIGYSDHTVGIGASPYAIAKGAKVIEKHFTLDCNAEGPDHKASLSPTELKKFVEEIRKTEVYMGNKIKVPTISEYRNRMSLQKYFVARYPIKRGEIFTEENLIAKRTGGKGISPIYSREVLNKLAKRDFERDEVIEL